MGDVAFESANLLRFPRPIVFQGQGDKAVPSGGEVGRGGALGPDGDDLDGSRLEADFLVA